MGSFEYRAMSRPYFCVNLLWAGLAHDSEETSLIREVCLWEKEIKGGLGSDYVLPPTTAGITKHSATWLQLMSYTAGESRYWNAERRCEYKH